MSKNFIDTEWYFGHQESWRVKIFTVSRRQLFHHKRFFEFLLKKEMPECERQHNLRVFVEQCRPELKGCHVWAFNFSMPKTLWEIGVEHESLPKCEDYCIIEDEPLVPRVGLDEMFYENAMNLIANKGPFTWSSMPPEEEKWELIAAECEPSEEEKPETWRDREPLL